MRTLKAGQSVLLLLDAVDVLKRQNINYAVIGALAASVHGAVRASMDADAVLSMAVQQIKSLEAAFQSAGFNVQLNRGDVSDPIAAVLQLKDQYENRVDLLIGLRGMEPETFSRSIDIPFHGEGLKVVGREDFIAMKVFAGSPQDLIDARRALTAHRETLDMPLLQRLAKQYSKEASLALQQLVQI